MSNSYITWASSCTTAIPYSLNTLQKTYNKIRKSEQEIPCKTLDIKKEKVELLFNPDDLDV